MTSKQINYIFLAFIAILGWNSFLIKRDAELFKVQQIPQENIVKQKTN